MKPSTLELTKKQKEILDMEFDTLQELQDFHARPEVKIEMNKLPGGQFVHVVSREYKEPRQRKGATLSSDDFSRIFT